MMLFNSASYLLFFPIVVALFYVLPSKLKKGYLLLASWYFYLCWNPYYLILLLLSTISTWFSGMIMDEVKNKFDAEKSRRIKNIIIAVCVAINLLILFVFKYSNFFIENINRILKIFHMRYSLSCLDILLPVGISFYTFQVIGYMIDIYRGDVQAEKNIIQYALFVSFFPQLVAGPIERSGNLMRQINVIDKSKVTFADVLDRIEKGLPIVIWGYFQKLVIADRAAILVDAVFNDFALYSSLDIIVAAVLFAIQIYCDFDGYTNIARGCAKILGFDLMKNFRQPYFSINIKEFWRRWHISLTTWFTDYLYIPLGGNRKGKFRKYINILIVFSVSGMWHGASWHYITWGLLHGLFLVGYNIISDARKNSDAEKLVISKRLVRIFGTFILTDFAWIFFRANGLREAVLMIKHSIMMHSFAPSFPNGIFNKANMIILFIGIIVLLIIDIMHENRQSLANIFWKQDSWFTSLVLSLVIMVILIFGVFGEQYDVTQFIYFQF